MTPSPLGSMPFDAATKRALLKADSSIDGALAVPVGRCIVFGSGCRLKTQEDAEAAYPSATYLWLKRESPSPVSYAEAGRRVEAALQRMAEDPALTPHAAAAEQGINHSAVYRAIALRQRRGVCECCGQMLPAA